MPYFKPGDWIQRPNQKSCHRVIRVRRDGVLIVEHASGQIRFLTRPERLRVIAPPEPEGQTVGR